MQVEQQGQSDQSKNTNLQSICSNPSFKTSQNHQAREGVIYV